MPSLKEYKAKLASLGNTRKITKTMKMVAASKLNRTMDAQRKGAAFAHRLNRMISRLSASLEVGAHPLLQKRANPKKCLVVLFTSDKGMCGGFNNNLIKFAHNWLETSGKNYQQVDLSFCGRRGWLYFRSRRPNTKHYEGVTHTVKYTDAVRIARDLVDGFLSGKYDEVYLGYNHFVSALSQKPALDLLLPISPAEAQKSEKQLTETFILEPPESVLLDRLLPKTVEYRVYCALLENAAGENGARMTAMDSATRNADDMIRLYTLLRNRARQASITKELIEIVSGAEALKG